MAGSVAAMLRRHPVLVAAGFFALAAGYFFWLQYTPTFADPDSFYHIKMTQLTAAHGPIRDFPWLPLTTLSDHFADQHFLYHVFLIPFVTLLQPVVGIKLATTLLAAALVTGVAWLVRRLGGRAPYLFATLLLVTHPFIFRLNLAKAPSVSLMLLLFGCLLLATRRIRAVALLAAVYVWAYGGFPALGIAAVCFWIAGVARRLLTRQSVSPAAVIRSVETKLLSAVVIGLGVGLVANPFFPNNISFFWEQFFDIGVRNYQSVIGVGGEWYPYRFAELVSASVFITIALLPALIMFWGTIRRQRLETIALFLLTALFFVATLKSRRYIEYYVPLATLFAALVLSPYLTQLSPRLLWTRFNALSRSRRTLAVVVVVYFLAAVPTVAVRDALSLRRDFVTGTNVERFAGAMGYLADHSAPGELVLHSDWDEFPILFYHNDRNRYVAGLDPTFLYLQHPELHRAWVAITSGEQRARLHETVRDVFGASWVFLEKDHRAMDRELARDPGFSLVYEDRDAKLYAVQ